MSEIPLARDLLRRARACFVAGELREGLWLHDAAMRLLFRDAPVRVASPRSARVTPAKRAEILRFARENPDASQQEIGVALGVDKGRVSEVLNGKAGHPKPSAEESRGLF